MVNRALHAISAGAACAIVSSAAAQAPLGGVIRGVVTDKEFGAPIGGATVSVLNTRIRGQTSDNGSYVLGNVAPGTYTVVITKDGYVRAVKANVKVGAGALAELDAVLAGEFEDMDEFVVRDIELGGPAPERTEITVPDNFEAYTILPPIEFRLRLEVPQLLDTVGVDAINRSGASDAAAVLLLVPGATLQDGKYAVIRGLPDRYVATLLDGVRLPTADPSKRAVKLDQFPAPIIQGIQVSKNFTPDQQGEASGGAVNIQLKDVPDEGYLRISGSVGTNSQVKSGQFLGYQGSKMDFWGGNESLANHPTASGVSWPNPTSTQYGAAPAIYKWAVAAGNSWEVDDGVKVGGFCNFYYDQDASAYNNGQLNQWQQNRAGTPLVPMTRGIDPDIRTALYDVSQGTESIQWGGVATVGIESENNRVSAKYLRTQLDESQAVLLTDTRGKSYFFPGYNVDDPPDAPGHGIGDRNFAPWQRLETLNYAQNSTQSLIIRGEHTLVGLGDGAPGDGPLDFHAPTLDWRYSYSQATEYQPNRTQFSAIWAPEAQIFPGFNLPASWFAERAAESSFAGWVQHVRYNIDEASNQGAANLKLPFTQWDDREGYVKVGTFVDSIARTYRQSSYSNPGDPNDSYQSGWNDPWSAHFPSQDHPMVKVPVISYDGAEDIVAGYGMIDLPFNETMNLVTGIRVEFTHMATDLLPDPGALWLDANTGQLRNFSQGAPNADFSENRYLPMVGVNWNVTDTLVLRTAFAQTLARPNFFELVPVLQYQYVGGPIFVGNSDLGMSSLNNYDARLDYTPHENWLISGSVFYKQIQDPIQYVNRGAAGFEYTYPVNFPDGSLLGLELESRVTLDPMLGDAWKGAALGANFTWMTSSVTLPTDFANAQKAYGAGDGTQPMVGTPEFLVNLNATYDVEPLGTQLGLFYTWKGETLISASYIEGGVLNPYIYQQPYGTLNFTLSQRVIGGLNCMFNAKNLLNPEIETLYKAPGGFSAVNSKYTSGVSLSFALVYQVEF